MPRFRLRAEAETEGDIIMAYQLMEVNNRARLDPHGFIVESDAAFAQKVSWAADLICENMRRSPIVLLSGPSGSGKTTTALKIEEDLRKRGILTHTIAMDNYYKPAGEAMPRTSEGEIDLESPLCLDMDLLNEHFTQLSEGEKIYVPKYNFGIRERLAEPSKTLRIGPEEIVIFEGIHALNDMITDVHPEAFKLYISARSNIASGVKICFKGTWMRLVRRTVRDNLFRGANAGVTLGMWANVRRGEKAFISPFKNKADLLFDSSLPYEVPVMKNLACRLFSEIPEAVERHEELRSIIPAFDLFTGIDPDVVRPNSLLREFIGGGIYDS